MRSIFLKKQKKTRGCRQRMVIRRGLCAAAAVCILTGMTLSAYGNETVKEGVQAPRKVVTDIYHKHEGNKGEQGGCYSVSISHKHQGDEKSGGACYQTPVYHSHQGNENEGGGCYTRPVFHEHQGDEQQGGACYGEITHVHTAECYQQADCLMTHAPDGNVYETWTDTCFSHGKVTFGKSQGIATHNDCDKGKEERTYTYCLTCGSVSPSIHSYQELICPIKEGTVTGYQRICGKKETTIDGYSTECEKNETTIEGYLLSCKKTVEEYAAGCGFQENQLCGKLILTNETIQQAEEVTISARLEDLTGGSLKLCTPPYEWRDESGRVIGNGDMITVNKNGKYSVTCKLENKDVDEAGLHSSILVDNIYIARPSESPSPSESPQPSESPLPSESPQPSESPLPSESPQPSESPMPSESPQPSESPIPSESPLPSESPMPSESPVPSQAPTAHPSSIPEDEQKPSSGQQGGSGEEAATLVPQASMIPELSDDDPDAVDDIRKSDETASAVRTRKTFLKEKNSLSPAQETAPVFKESQTVELEEQEASKEAVTVKEEKRRTRVFDIPAVKIITVAGSVLALIFAILLLLFYLRRSVKVLNDDGEGRMIYLGHCMVKTENNCYQIVITEKMEEKACTNRYCIRPGLFRLGKKEGEELVIVKGSKSVTSYIDKEMIVML